MCPSFPAGTKPQERSETSAGILMGSKKNFTTAQGFETLPEDGELEKTRPVWGRCRHTGKAFASHGALSLCFAQRCLRGHLSHA